MLTPSAFPRQSGAGALHIHELIGSIGQIGSYAAGGQRYPLYAVRLRARVCFRSAAEAQTTYPAEFRITHYAVRKSPREWWNARDVRDKPHWMVVRRDVGGPVVWGDLRRRPDSAEPREPPLAR